MKLTILLLLMLAAGFGFWKYNEQQKPTTPDPITHTVKKGDTLIGIAARNNTTVQSIQKNNNLHNTNIHPGQKLTIHPGQQTKGKIAETKKSNTTNHQNTKSPTTNSPKKNPPRAQIIGDRKPTPAKPQPKTLVRETRNIAIDIDDQNQVYLRNPQGKFTPAGKIIYGSEPDAEGREVKTITYSDLKGKQTTLRGSAAPEDVIRLALKK